jgi:hypothetical protein
MVIVFNRESLEISIDAPDMSLDFGLSLLERAKRVLEAQEKIVLTQKAIAVSRAEAQNELRSKAVLDRIKLQ